MIRKYCDRCGAEIVKETHTNVLYDIVSYFCQKANPKMKIKLVYEGASGLYDEVELCEKCKKELLEWFNRGGGRGD